VSVETPSRLSVEQVNPSRERLALALWLALAALQVAAAFALQTGTAAASDSTDEPLYDFSLGVGSIFLYAILAALTFGIASLLPDRRAALGLRPFAPRALWLVAAIVVASLAVSAILEPVLHAGREQGLEPEQWDSAKAAPFLFNALVIVTVVPLTEELFYRGLGIRVLSVFGSVVAALGTAVIFALAHGIVVAVPALGFFALLLAWLRLRTGSIWPGVIAHATYNGLGLLAFFLTSTS
jgi:membrane protease YdiL (CAAX protease family)